MNSKRQRYILCEYNHRPKHYVIFEETDERPPDAFRKITGHMSREETMIRLELMGLEIGDEIEELSHHDGKRVFSRSFGLV